MKVDTSQKQDNITKFYKYRLFKENGRGFLYNSVTNAIFEIDDIIIEILKCTGKSEEETNMYLLEYFEQDKIDKAIQSMKDAFIIANKHNEMQIDQFNTIQCDGGISSLTLFMIQECNLRCTYCYGEEGEYHEKGRMTDEVAFAAVDFLIKQSGKNQNLNITFFGGEPLLNFSLIQQTVNYVKKQALLYNKDFTFSITTNGTLITSKIKDFFYENNFSVQISIDGDEKTHNYNRVFKGGQGSYQLVVKRTEEMRKENRLIARGTVTANELNISKSFDKLVELGFRRIYLSPAIYTLSSEQYDILSHEMVKLVYKFSQLLEDGDYSTTKKMSNIMGMLNKIHSGGPRTHSCGAGKYTIAVDVRGNLFPCHRFVGEKDYCIGNIYDDVLNKQKEFISNAHINSRTTCSNCWAKNLCAGGCHQENFMKNGSINLPIIELCKVNKRFIEKTIELYLQLNQEQKNILFG